MKSCTLLIVEDDLSTRKWEEVYFNESDFTFAFASTAKEALEKLEKKNYDYVITDVMLPITTGLDLAHLVAEGHPQTKVILCSAISEFDAYKNYPDTIGYIEKPIYPYKVLELIEEYEVAHA